MAVKVYNIVEELVEEHMKIVLEKYPNMCHCEQCIADVAAISLNHLKPRYVSSQKGDVMARVMGTTDVEVINILKEITSAVEAVIAKPHHPDLPKVMGRHHLVISCVSDEEE